MSALLLMLALQGPATWRSSELQIELPRPFADWIFDAEAEQGTTTVIFHPRSAPLGDHLWGALVVTPWGSPPAIGELADRRVADTWRRTLGSSFSLVSREQVRVAGAAAVRLRMSGSIERAVLEIEEYVIARGNDLLLLQLRYPRGVPRDSIAAGYQRLLNGMRLALEAPAVESGMAPREERGVQVFEIPASMRAISSGTLVANVVTGDQRVMRYRPHVEDTVPLYAVGEYTESVRRRGRFTTRIWRAQNGVSDSVVSLLERGWSIYWRAFGPVPLAELQIVETDWPQTRGAPGIVFVGADANPYVLLRELARTWWGGFLRHDAIPVLLNEAMPSWSPIVAGVPGTDSLAIAVERGRIAAGESRWREILRTLSAATRDPNADNPFSAFPAFSAFLPFCPICQQNR